MNGTLQGRLVNELRAAGITTVAAANRYLRERFLPDFNAEFHRAPADPAPAFVPLGAVDLEQILCHQDERVVARDNTVALDGVVMQLAKQVGRRTCAGLHVLVRRHLDGQHSVWLGARRLGLFDARGARGHFGGRVTEHRAGFGQGQIAAPSINAALRGCKVARAARDVHEAVKSRCQNRSGHFTCQRQPPALRSPPALRCGCNCYLGHKSRAPRA